MPETPSVPADTPLDPHQGNTEDEERHEVRDHEGATAVLGGLHREAQEIAQSDGIPGHRQDQTDPGAPTLAWLKVCHARRPPPNLRAILAQVDPR